MADYLIGTLKGREYDAEEEWQRLSVPLRFFIRSRKAHPRVTEALRPLLAKSFFGSPGLAMLDYFFELLPHDTETMDLIAEKTLRYAREYEEILGKSDSVSDREKARWSYLRDQLSMFITSQVDRLSQSPGLSPRARAFLQRAAEVSGLARFGLEKRNFPLFPAGEGPTCPYEKMAVD